MCSSDLSHGSLFFQMSLSLSPAGAASQAAGPVLISNGSWNHSLSAAEGYSEPLLTVFGTRLDDASVADSRCAESA